MRTLVFGAGTVPDGSRFLGSQWHTRERTLDSKGNPFRTESSVESPDVFRGTGGTSLREGNAILFLNATLAGFQQLSCFLPVFPESKIALLYWF